MIFSGSRYRFSILGTRIGSLKQPKKPWLNIVPLNNLLFSHIKNIRESKRGNVSDLSKLRTKRPNMHCGKDFSADVTSRAWERKFVCSSVGT